MIDGDITSLAVDCIVSNDDVDGRMYTVIASSIKSAAGPDVERQSLAQGPFRRGQAWHTDAGALPSPIKAVIHVAAMDRRGDTDRKTIVECVTSALEEARTLNLRSVAIAAFGTGPRGAGPKVIAMDDWLSDVTGAILHRFQAWEREAADERAAADGRAAEELDELPPSAEGPAVSTTIAAEAEADKTARPILNVLLVLYELQHFKHAVETLRRAAHETQTPASGEALGLASDELLLARNG